MASVVAVTAASVTRWPKTTGFVEDMRVIPAALVTVWVAMGDVLPTLLSSPL